MNLWHILPTYHLDAGKEELPVEDYQRSGSTAIISVVGATSKFGANGTLSTSKLRQQVRAAAQDDSVENVLFYIDSPGGEVAGSRDLQRDVAALSRVKPTQAYASDIMASAAYGLASQTDKIVASDGAFIGSIGTMSMLTDTSELAAKMGIKVHPITSGGMKGAGQFGTPITADQIAYHQGMINKVNDQFLQSIASGRNMNLDRVRQLADGRVHIAADAAQLGLIDDVATLEAAVDDLKNASSNQRIFSMSNYTGQTGDPAALATPMPAQQTQQPQQPAAPAPPQQAAQPQQQPVLFPIDPNPAPTQPIQQQAQPAPAQPIQQQPAATPPAPQQPKAATIEEIEQACPHAPADFVLQQVRSGATLQQAQTAYIGLLVQQQQTAPPAPAPQVGQAPVQPLMPAPVPAPQQPWASAPQASVPAPQTMWNVPGGQPVFQQQADDQPVGGDPNLFYNAELEKEKTYLRDSAPHLDPHEQHKTAVLNVYRRYPHLREARMQTMNQVPVRAPKAPQAPTVPQQAPVL